MDKGPIRQRVAPASRGDGDYQSNNSGDECETADIGQVGAGASELPKKCKTTTGLASSLYLCRRTRGFLILSMALVGWILLMMLFSGSSSSSRRVAQQVLHTVTGGLQYYTPTLYSSAAAGSDNDDKNNNKEKYKKEDFPWPMIHIVNTRFMQEQPNLTALGQARLALFQVFCLPTMQHQTSQQLLWIIRTDPNLDTPLLKQLVRLVQPFPNIYIVGSNCNTNWNYWRDGAQGRDLAGTSCRFAPVSLFPTRVYSGNQTLLEMAMALEAQLPVLETRLDADDGLNVQFIETVQKEALEQAFSPLQQQQQQTAPRLKWKYWCTPRSVQWQWSAPGNHDNASSVSYGKISGVIEPYCIAGGITAAFPVGTTKQQVPHFPHTQLANRIHQDTLSSEQSCGLDNPINCLEFLKVEPFEVVRSRTPTSTGMVNVHVSKEEEEEDKKDDAMWDVFNSSFRIQREQVRFVQEYFKDNLVDIAKDNLVGQCTKGHSCTNEAKESLKAIIATYSDLD